ncbi:Ppx/GppA phosphatase family protein [Pedobacter montanisoli]|uniref:Exopolyphosphatase n=1 Tax=Pedobacter montanisoli TaxID=2923277 RepID=A0ABS9ZZ31_9SPHI|nr:exopolyphosphatase [Pedobacter montanisoli]MCJ0743566.1 exopolyphosphatase [Pedobacter montanisoli]
MKKIAVIDLGTNTFHLVIAEVRLPGSFEVVYKTNQPVKLGENITLNNEIIPTAFERGLSCLEEFHNVIKQHRVDRIRAVATSAVRSAKNGNDFVQTVKKITGITIEIIDGIEEASLIYEGVKASGSIHSPSLIMDIGGGSTEFILCDQKEIFWKQSYNIGAARLLQQFFHSDPLSKEDNHKIKIHLENQLQSLIQVISQYQPQVMIGSAGAFESFYQMLNPHTHLSQIISTDIAISAYAQLAEKLLHSTHAERLQIPGLIPLRTDMIVMAVIQTSYVLELAKVEQLKLCSYDLKMGILAQISKEI